MNSKIQSLLENVNIGEMHRRSDGLYVVTPHQLESLVAQVINQCGLWANHSLGLNIDHVVYFQHMMYEENW